MALTLHSSLFVLAAVALALLGCAAHVSADGQCQPGGYRTDCGYVGINQQGCEAKGCCWSPLDPNPDNAPWCFYKMYNTGTYQYSTGTFDDVSYKINVKVNGSVETRFGNMFSQATIEINCVSKDTVNIQMYDFWNQRYTIPEWVVPGTDYSNLVKCSEADYAIETVDDGPFSIKITRKSDGKVLFDSSVGELILTDQYLEVSTVIDSDISATSDPKVFGLGEHRVSFALPTNDNTLTFWAHDAPTPDYINEYGSHPFYLVQSEATKTAHGGFMRNSNGMDVTLNHNILTYKMIGGIVDLTIFAGESPEEVTQQYHTTIGKPAAPPLWSLGWHQSRYGYPNIAFVEEVVQKYAAAGIPLETIWNDIDYMDAYKDFTWDPVKYSVPTVQKFVDQLKLRNQKYVVIVDPAIHNQQGYSAYDMGVAADIFIKEGDGKTDFIGAVWPGSTAFPDFMNKNTHLYWKKQISDFLDEVEVDGLWIDMNEPSNFGNGPNTTASKYVNPPYAINNLGSKAPLNQKTLAMDCVHYLEDGTRLAEYDVHNLYGITEAIATHEALTSLRPNIRPFILSRSTFSGSGAYTAHWSGDNFASFDSMASSVRQVLNFNMFGIPMIGSDICGFLENTFEELCNRWTALGAFYPFARNHNDIHSKPQEPYLWPSVTATAKKVLTKRYELLPYLYSLFLDANANGGTVARPIFFEFPEETDAYSIDTQYMLGPALLVSPVLAQGVSSFNAYIPQARWYDLWTYEELSTSKRGEQSFPAGGQGDIMVNIRGGQVVTTQGFANTTAEVQKQPYGLVFALDENNAASGRVTIDDGKTINGGSTVIEFSSTSNFCFKNQVVTHSFVPYNAQLTSVTFAGAPTVSSVTLNGEGISFQQSGGVVTVHPSPLKITDSFVICIET